MIKAQFFQLECCLKIVKVQQMTSWILMRYYVYLPHWMKYSLQIKCAIYKFDLVSTFDYVSAE